MRRPDALVGALASVLTLGLATAAVLGVDRTSRPVGALVGGALVWSGLPLATYLMAAARVGGRTAASSAGVATTAPAGTGSVTTVIRLGAEPLEVARTSILLASRAGPTVVITSGATVPESIRGLPVVIVEAPTFGDGIARALPHVMTDAVHLVSARTVPVKDACARAASLIGPGVGWVVGRARSFNGDGYVADSREPVTAGMRAAARAGGLVVWEPDATLVRTDLLRRHPVDPRRPLGRWLRSRADEGERGAAVDDVLARRAAPVDAAAYWPDAASRQWARVADLAAAACRGRARTRMLALGLLAHELFAYPVLVWMAAPLLVGPAAASPYSLGVGKSLALVTALAALRWLAVRRALHLRPRPVTDIVSALNQLPGSLAAIGAAVTRRLPRAHLGFPSRPLVWAALVLTIGTGERIIAGSTAGDPAAAMAVPLITLVVLWVFSMGALAQRDWTRSTYRIPLDLPVSVGGLDMRAVNGSPTGLAATGRVDADRFPVGYRVPIRVDLDDGSTLTSAVTVSDHRTVGGREIVGLSLSLDDHGRGAWVDQLSRAADHHHHRHGDHRRGDRVPVEVALADSAHSTRSERLRRRVDVLVVAGAGLLSVCTLAALALLIAGYRPLVIRSGSMVPTLAVGDVVLEKDAPVGLLRPGDIANLSVVQADGTETLTHRVVAIEDVPGGVVVETQGDANTSGERTVLPAESLVGRVRWRIPWIGRPATAMRTSPTQLLVGVAALVVITIAILRRPR